MCNMENVIKIISTFIVAILSGSCFYFIVNKKIMKTKGKNSPIIDGDATGNHFGDNK